jgi:UDP-3-O-[3-hydroxymyristoyl] glucosamine N-acyltransferase
MSVSEIAALTGAELLDPAHGDVQISAVATLQQAGPRHIAFYDNARYAEDLALTMAGACLVGPRFTDNVPAGTAVLRSRKPFASFVEIARRFHEVALRPGSGFGLTGIAVSAVVHPEAHLEDDVVVDPLAVIGPGAEIGSGTVIGSGSVIGPGVRIGRDCSIGAGVTIQHALVGNNVILHPGCQIGQDGFGFTQVGGKHRKVPQTGRVVIQHDVEVGSGTAIDRGSLRDTVIGEGTKIDNHVQIGHNVRIGRHCVIAGQCGLSGSLSLGDYVVLAAKVGINNHVHIGDGAQIAATSAVIKDVPANERWGGVFAKPVRQWFRELVAVERLGRAAPERSVPHATDHAADGTEKERG